MRNITSVECVTSSSLSAHLPAVFKLLQGRPIYRKISFLWIFIACLSLRKKPRFVAESTDFFLLGPTTTPPLRNFGRIYGFLRTQFGYYPPPPPPTLDSRHLAHAESATTRNLRIFVNSHWATLLLPYILMVLFFIFAGLVVQDLHLNFSTLLAVSWCQGSACCGRDLLQYSSRMEEYQPPSRPPSLRPPSLPPSL